MYKIEINIDVKNQKRGHKRYVIVGGVFGCVIAAGLAVRAIWYIVGYPISRMRPAITEKECKGIIW